jgi:hypothetical protein
MRDPRTAIVLGNGESRSTIDLRSFYDQYTLIGCNAVYRDFSIHHLVCCDRRMVEESISDTDAKIYTRSRSYKDFRKLRKEKNVNLLPDIPYQGNKKEDQEIHWGSGPYAVLLACVLGFQDIYLVGFDLYGIDDQINNIYKDSKNYLPRDSRPVDPSYWIYQIKKLFHIFKHRNFKVLNHESWTMPREWKLPNVEFFETKKIYDLLIYQ